MFDFISFIYPARCPYCKKIISNKLPACSECSKKYLNFIIDDYINTSCGEKIYGIAPAKYKDEVKGAIWRYKFRNHRNYANQFGIAIYNIIIRKYKDQKFDLITSVPISKERLKERGYNQSELIAKIVSRLLNIPYKNLLYKSKNNYIQHELPYKKRSLNVKNVYSIIDPKFIKRKNIILCDDIITTGNTIGECANMLIKTEANDVKCVAIAFVKR